MGRRGGRGLRRVILIPFYPVDICNTNAHRSAATQVPSAAGVAAMVTGQLLYVDGGWALQGHGPEPRDFDYSADRQRDE